MIEMINGHKEKLAAAERLADKSPDQEEKVASEMG